MSEPKTEGVTIGGGDKGVDRSQTTIDSSSRVTKTADAHSVRTTSRDDHSSRTTNVNDNSWKTTRISADDNRKKSHVSINGGTMLGVVALLVVAVLVIWLVPTGGTAPSPATSAQASPVLAESRTASRAATLPVPEPARPQAERPSPVSPSATALTAPAGGPSMRSDEAAPAVAPRVAPSVLRADSSKRKSATFLNRGMLGPGRTFVLIVDERRGYDAILTQRMAAMVDGSDGLFKSPFVGDRLFSRAQKGDADVLREIGVTPDVARVLLDTRTVSFAPTEVAGQALVRATVSLSVRAFRPADSFTSSMAAAREVGAGFDEDSATTVATENVLEKLRPQLR